MFRKRKKMREREKMTVLLLLYCWVWVLLVLLFFLVSTKGKHTKMVAQSAFAVSLFCTTRLPLPFPFPVSRFPPVTCACACVISFPSFFGFLVSSIWGPRTLFLVCVEEIKRGRLCVSREWENGNEKKKSEWISRTFYCCTCFIGIRQVRSVSNRGGRDLQLCNRED